MGSKPLYSDLVGFGYSLESISSSIAMFCASRASALWMVCFCFSIIAGESTTTTLLVVWRRRPSIYIRDVSQPASERIFCVPPLVLGSLPGRHALCP